MLLSQPLFLLPLWHQPAALSTLYNHTMFSTTFWSDLPAFSDTFAAARQRLLTSFQQLTTTKHNGIDYIYREILHPLTGPDQQPLATDVIWLGPKDSQQVLVFISGTHGIEGYAGSAIQNLLLNQLMSSQLLLPKGMAVLFIHALNPWGMAWHRRCDEQGIDLNRNFVDFSQPLPHDDDYDKIRPWMFEADTLCRETALAELSAEMGARRFEQALSSGQYQDPLAPFYGGVQPSFGHQTIVTLMQDFQLADKHLLVLDLHTGLGPWSYGELICDHPVDSQQQYFAQSLFTAGISLPAKGTSCSVPKYGLLDYTWHQIMDNNSCFLTLEFGTYSTHDLFNTLINEHIHWAKADSNILAHQQSQPSMLKHFCPDDRYWQQAITFQAWQLTHLILSRWTTSG